MSWVAASNFKVSQLNQVNINRAINWYKFTPCKNSKFYLWTKHKQKYKNILDSTLNIMDFNVYTKRRSNYISNIFSNKNPNSWTSQPSLVKLPQLNNCKSFNFWNSKCKLKNKPLNKSCSKNNKNISHIIPKFFLRNDLDKSIHKKLPFTSRSSLNNIKKEKECIFKNHILKSYIEKSTGDEMS